MEIKKEVIIKSHPSSVYKAITDPEQLTQWFPDVASIEPKVGGKISFRFSKSGTDNAIQDHGIEGEITELEKNKRIVYTWGYLDNPEFPLTRVSWNLEPIGIGMTKVTITHTGFTDEKLMKTYDDGWSWFMGRLSIFAMPKHPVNVGGQLVSAFIPGVDIFAFYRIKKLRKSILYLLLPAIILTGIFYSSNDAFQTYMDNNPEKSGSGEVYFIAVMIMFLMLASVLIGIAFTNYFMHKWSEEWNQQFLQT